MAGIIPVGTLRIVKDKVKFISQSTLLVLIPSTSKYEPSLQLNCPTCLNTKEQCSLFPQNSLCYGTPAPLNYHPTSQNTATLKVKLKHYHLCFFLFAHKCIGLNGTQVPDDKDDSDTLFKKLNSFKSFLFSINNNFSFQLPH